MEALILAKFYRGPFDGQMLALPTAKPWPRFVIPKFGAIVIEHFYLYSGVRDEIYFYLYEDFSSITDDELAN